MTWGQPAIAAEDLLILLGGELGDAQRTAEVAERHGDVDQDRDDKEEERQNDRRAEEDDEVRTPASRRPRMATALVSLTSSTIVVIGCSTRPVFVRLPAARRSTRRTESTAQRVDRAYLTITSFRLDDRLVDHEVSSILGGQSPRLNALDCGIDDAVELAKLRIVGQEFGDLKEFRRPGERPGLLVARILELLGLDAEVRRGHRMVGVEVGRRRVAK